MIKLIFKIVIQLIIAGIIFLALLYFLPFFEQEQENDPDAQSSIQEYQGVSRVFAQEGSTVLRDFEEEPYSESVKKVSLSPETTISKNKKSCSLPRGERQLSHGKFVKAYKDPIADGENVCHGELRICDNGDLLGGYQYQTCVYEVDGVKQGKEIIPGATQTEHNLFTFIKGAEKSQEYIQPARYSYPNQEKKQDYTYNLNGQRIQNNPQTVARNPQNTTTPPLSQSQTMDCRAPWGDKVNHGEYVVAYKTSASKNIADCISQKRPCLDGTLLGSYTHQSCTISPRTITHPETEYVGIPQGKAFEGNNDNPIRDDRLPELSPYRIIEENEPTTGVCQDCTLTIEQSPLTGDQEPTQ